MLFIFQLTPAVICQVFELLQWPYKSVLRLREFKGDNSILQLRQFLCNRPISVSYAYKKETKGERLDTFLHQRDDFLALLCTRCKHLFSSSSSLLNQYDLCLNSCLLGVLRTAGTAAQLSVSLLPIVQSRKRKRCWWDKLQHQTRNFASKGFFSKQKGSKGIRWNKDPLFGKLKASEQQGTRSSWRIGKEARRRAATKGDLRRAFPTVFTLERLVPVFCCTHFWQLDHT